MKKISEISEIVDEVSKLINYFGISTVLLFLVLIGLLVYFLKYSIPSYLEEKSKNQATKEDIAEITDKIESVRSDYQLLFAQTEREKNLKKDVYMEAVGAFTGLLNAIPALLNLDIDDKEISSKIISDESVISKVMVVGSESTVKSVTEFNGDVGAVIMELMLERGNLMIRKNEIKIIADLRSESQAEVERYIGMMKNFLIQGDDEQELWLAIKTQLDDETKVRDSYSTKISELWKVQNEEHLTYTKKCMDCFFDVSENLPSVILSVRDELDLSIPKEAYLDIYNKHLERGRIVFQDFFNKVSVESPSE